MKPFETKGFSKYGASLGRYTHPLPEGPPDGPKLRLQRVRLDQGGYDKGGAYWGSGAPLWCAWNDEGGGVFYIRAANRTDAKEQLQREHAGTLAFKK